MTKQDIIDQLAKEGKVEELVKNITKGSKRPEIDDLTQNIYEILLNYDEDKIVQMYEKKQLIFFITRIITNQYNSSNSPFHYTYRKYYADFEDIANIKDEPTTD